MKYKVLKVINIILLLFTVSLFVYELAFAKERNIKLMVKAGTVSLIFLLSFLRIRPKHSPFDKYIYKDFYKNIIGDAFSRDTKGMSLLTKAITDYNYNKFEKAIKTLDTLLENYCAESCDFSAVLMFKALCLNESGRNNAAAECYEQLLSYDPSNSTAWSNLGLIYTNIGNMQRAEQAYTNAINADPDNSKAYTNYSVLLLHQGKAEKALESSEKALELDSKLTEAAISAAVASQLLGDEEKLRKYKKIHSLNGGNARELDRTLDAIK
ncbi:MAG: tetratricopeptide repeat protein [Oscillospiraceae bacterium]